MATGIYALEFLDGKIYVGSSKNLEARKYHHLHKLEKSIHSNQFMQESFDKCGKPKFTILEMLETYDNIHLIEQKWIDTFPKEKLLNCCFAFPCAKYGKHLSPETKVRLSNALKGRKMSTEWKEHIQEGIKKSLADKRAFLKAWPLWDGTERMRNSLETLITD